MISCTIEIAAALDWPKPLRILADAGFGRVNLPAWFRGARGLAWDRHVEALRAELRGHGLAVDWVHAPYGDNAPLHDANPERRADALACQTHYLEQAARLGARAVVYHGYFGRLPDGVPVADAGERLVDAFGQLADRARRLGVLACLENLTADESNRCHEAVMDGVPELRFCFDAGHAHLRGNAARWFPRYGARLGATHLHDNDGAAGFGGADDAHRIPGDGTIDWPAMKRLLDENGLAALDVPLGLEIHPQPYPAEAAVRAYAAARAVERGEAPARGDPRPA